MSLCHVRIVTSDRVIHHFDSLAEAEQFKKLPRATREPRHAAETPPVPYGHRRQAVMALVAEQPGISAPDIASLFDASVNAINTILRRLTTDGFVVFAGKSRNKRRTYHITALGLAALESTTKEEA